MRWTVSLHGHASARVEVEADNYPDACRKAIETAPKTKGVAKWTPTSASPLPTPEQEATE